MGLTEPANTAVLTEPTAEPRLDMEEVLAGPGRVWIRGQIVGVPIAAKPVARKQWWRPRRQVEGAPRQTAAAHLETRISGQIILADPLIQPDGGFEAQGTLELPQARRGWRMARTRLSWQGHTWEKCSLVCAVPEGYRRAVAVILPLDLLANPQGVTTLAVSALVRFGTQLRSLVSQGEPSAYYLGAAPSMSSATAAELALALKNLGWPSGNLVMLTGASLARDRLIQGIDRLRWLFVDGPSFHVLNLEPELNPEMASILGPQADRASADLMVLSNLASEIKEDATPATAAKFGARPTRSFLVPRYPVVFCHGMLAFSTLKMQLPKDLNCFWPLRDFLRDRGFQALYPQVAPTSGVAARAEQLRDLITAWTDQPVNIVAHSMGGLDARYLISRLGMASRVRSLTTIATPHRGTHLVEWFIANFRNRVPLLLALEAMGVNVDGFADCRPAACAAFNAQTPDDPSVKYFSFGGDVPFARLTPVLRRAWNLLMQTEGPNDGMVSVASARWGEYLGTIAADHYAQTPDMTFVRPGEDFDALGFYLRLLADLARRGF